MLILPMLRFHPNQSTQTFPNPFLSLGKSQNIHSSNCNRLIILETIFFIFVRNLGAFRLGKQIWVKDPTQLFQKVSKGLFSKLKPQ